MDAVTGECSYHEEVPQWVDRVYLASLIMEQYDYYGTLVHGFINSVFGQRDVKITTEGYNYIALNDDVYMYTGVTSATSDQSNLGFLLCNQRTKETKFYTIPGATEQSARASAEGMVQDHGYRPTCPLLLNIPDQPTYFIALKDDRQLVKKYAMVNVGQFNLVGIGDTVAACEQDYLRLLGEKGIAAPEERIETQVSGTVAEIRSAVLDGTTYTFIRLEGEEVFYSLSAVQNPVAVLLNAGDLVTIDHAPQAEGESSSILDGYTLTVEGKAAPEPSSVPEAGSGTEDWAEVPILLAFLFCQANTPRTAIPAVLGVSFPFGWHAAAYLFLSFRCTRNTRAIFRKRLPGLFGPFSAAATTEKSSAGPPATGAAARPDWAEPSYRCRCPPPATRVPRLPRCPPRQREGIPFDSTQPTGRCL